MPASSAPAADVSAVAPRLPDEEGAAHRVMSEAGMLPNVSAQLQDEQQPNLSGYDLHGDYADTLRSVAGTHFTEHGATMAGSPASPMPGCVARGAGHVNRVTVKL